MKQTMKQAILIEPGRLVVREAPIPTPGPGEVRIAVEVCGICGTDVHAFLGEHPFISTPIVPGHEFSGVIDAIGAGVAGLSIGTPVTAEPGLACGQCEMCCSGRYNICENLKVLGCQSTGAMAEYVCVPAANVVRLLGGITFEQAALIETTAVAVHALRRADLSGVDQLLVIGAGPIGLQTVQVATAWRIPIIVAVDLVDSRLELAAKLGATYAVNVKKTSLGDFLKAKFGKSSAMDLVVECVGSQAALAQAIEAVKKGRQIVIVGVLSVDPVIKLSWVQDRELVLLGTLMYTRGDFEEAMSLIASGAVQADALITRRYPLAQATDAMRDLLSNRDTVIKAVIAVRNSQSHGGIW